MGYYVNVDFNSVSAVNIVIAVGLAIDSSVHIAHAFLTAHGTRNERAREALRRLGRSVTNGAVSTFLAIVVLADAQSYIFRVLFKLLGLIIMLRTFTASLFCPSSSPSLGQTRTLSSSTSLMGWMRTMARMLARQPAVHRP